MFGIPVSKYFCCFCFCLVLFFCFFVCLFFVFVFVFFFCFCFVFVFLFFCVCVVREYLISYFLSLHKLTILIKNDHHLAEGPYQTLQNLSTV